jgi:hypothetical protein
MTSEQPPTEPTAPPPSGAPVAAATGGGFSMGPGQIITAIGSLAVGVACFLEWLRAGNGARSANADVVPWDFLWDKSSLSSTSILVWLIPIAVLILVAAIVPQLRFVALAGGIAALAVAGVYAFQLNALIDSFKPRDVGSVYDHLGIGDYVVAGGGFIAIVGALVPRPTRSSA